MDRDARGVGTHHAPLRQAHRRGRHPLPPEPQGQPTPYTHPPQARGRRRGHGPHRRPGPPDLPRRRPDRPGDEGPRAGPQGGRGRRPGGHRRRPDRQQGHPRPHRPHRGTHVGPAPHGGRRRPVRARDRRQRRPARHRHGPRRPGTPPAPDRPLPGGGVRRGPGTAPGHDQVGPRLAGQALGALRPPGHPVRRHQPRGTGERRGRGPGPRAARRPDHRLRGPLGCRQDDPGQLAGPGGAPCG